MGWNKEFSKITRLKSWFLCSSYLHLQKKIILLFSLISEKCCLYAKTSLYSLINFYFKSHTSTQMVIKSKIQISNLKPMNQVKPLYILYKVNPILEIRVFPVTSALTWPILKGGGGFGRVIIPRTSWGACRSHFIKVSCLFWADVAQLLGNLGHFLEAPPKKHLRITIRLNLSNSVTTEQNICWWGTIASNRTFGGSCFQTFFMSPLNFEMIMSLRILSVSFWCSDVLKKNVQVVNRDQTMKKMW